MRMPKFPNFRVDHDHEDIMSQLTLASSTVPADMGRARRDGFSENDSGPAHPYKSLRPTGALGPWQLFETQ